MIATPSNRAAARIVASLCAAFVVSQFYRSSTAVIAPELTRDVDLSAEALGGLTGAFFLAFAVAQIPVGALIAVAVLAALAPAPALALWQAAALLVALGGFGVYAMMIIAHGRAIFPERLVGRGLTVVNFANFIGVAVMQMAAGMIVGAFPAADGAAPEAAYRLVFGFLAATIVLALVFYARAADAKPSQAAPAA